MTSWSTQKSPIPQKDGNTQSQQVINPTKICKNTKCRYCPKLDFSGKVRSTTTGKTYILPQRITCKFNNLIYLIPCKICKSQYVGQTGNSIQMRFQKHLKDIEHCTNWTRAPPSIKSQGPTNVGQHFAQRGHSVNDIQINVLGLIRRDPSTGSTKDFRVTIETFWMQRLKILKPFGINVTDGSTHVRSQPNRSLLDQPHGSQT